MHTPLAHRPRDITELTGYSRAFVYQLISDGKLPHIRVGRSVRVMHTDLMAFLDQHREGGNPDAA
jgi:excisionase family DNA binding protein